MRARNVRNSEEYFVSGSTIKCRVPRNMSVGGWGSEAHGAFGRRLPTSDPHRDKLDMTLATVWEIPSISPAAVRFARMLSPGEDEGRAGEMHRRSSREGILSNRRFPGRCARGSPARRAAPLASSPVLKAVRIASAVNFQLPTLNSNSSRRRQGLD